MALVDGSEYPFSVQGDVSAELLHSSDVDSDEAHATHVLGDDGAELPVGDFQGAEVVSGQELEDVDVAFQSQAHTPFCKTYRLHD